MPRIHSPRRGSMAYSPRKRAARIYPRVRTWPISDDPKLLGFAGYKAGMTHMFVRDPRKDSPTSGKDVFTPVTILECPDIVPFAIRFYKRSAYGFTPSGELWAENLNSLSPHIAKKINIPKKTPSSPPSDADRVTLLVSTLPSEASVPKKKPEIFEIAVGGTEFEDQLKFAKSLLGKRQKPNNVFKAGEYIDVVAVTKGKGMQGPVKRFGVKVDYRKGHSKARHVGSLGNRASPTRWTVPMAGQMGYGSRTEFNKMIVQIGEKGDAINPKGGFVNYGVIGGSYIAIKGSVPGPAKRLVRLRAPIRSKQSRVEPEITYISLESKQGR